MEDESISRSLIETILKYEREQGGKKRKREKTKEWERFRQRD